jgi:NAD(P)-dependent dehydrogenase (short-subunit alcohol dehydrogenase family)
MADAQDPRDGPTPSEEVPEQDFPGVEKELIPKADHGEESYRGCGKLEGRVALVTGGDSGIGRAVCIAFAREGADVAIGYLSDKEAADAEQTRKWVEKAGRRCFLRRFDVRQKRECIELVSQTRRELGRIDILVNNAAYQMSQESLQDYSEEQIHRTFHTNIIGYLFMAQAVVPQLEPGSVIVNTGSITGMEGNPGLIDYAATKGAIHILTKSLATHLAEKGIRVNCVAPGPVWTPLIPSTMDHEHVTKFGADTVWKRPAQPAEIAPTFVYLASDDSRYLTGEIIGITGRATTR